MDSVYWQPVSGVGGICSLWCNPKTNTNKPCKLRVPPLQPRFVLLYAKSRTFSQITQSFKFRQLTQLSLNNYKVLQVGENCIVFLLISFSTLVQGFLRFFQWCKTWKRLQMFRSLLDTCTWLTMYIRFATMHSTSITSMSSTFKHGRKTIKLKPLKRY